MEKRQIERVGEVLEEKKARARQQSKQGGPLPPSGSEPSGDQADLTSAQRPQDTASVRAKSSGKKKKTADKWNQ